MSSHRYWSSQGSGEVRIPRSAYIRLGTEGSQMRFVGIPGFAALIGFLRSRAKSCDYCQADRCTNRKRC